MFGQMESELFNSERSSFCYDAPMHHRSGAHKQKTIQQTDVTNPINQQPGVHKSFQPTSRAGSTRSKFGARGEHGERGEDGKHGDVLRFSTEVFSVSPT